MTHHYPLAICLYIIDTLSSVPSFALVAEPSGTRTRASALYFGYQD